KKEIYKLGQEKLRLAIDQKNRELSSLALKIAQKTEILSELKKGVEKDHENIDGLIKGIERQLNTKEDWEAFRFHFEEVHPEFFNKLKRLFPSLTPNEERLCAFIKLNLSTKKIAQLNNNTVVAVDKGRNRLRKKLGLSPDISIKDFLDTVQ
ncbi:MAG: transcriptional regulator, partial [Bacteroidales bacterium]|nr:transcriptional regulator [Bacteroidales bacterium]